MPLGTHSPHSPRTRAQDPVAVQRAMAMLARCACTAFFSRVNSRSVLWKQAGPGAQTRPGFLSPYSPGTAPRPPPVQHVGSSAVPCAQLRARCLGAACPVGTTGLLWQNELPKGHPSWGLSVTFATFHLSFQETNLATVSSAQGALCFA